MTRYHFHVQDGQAYPDEAGIELATRADVQTHALRTLGELCCEKPTLFWEGETLSVHVADHTDLSLFTLQESIVKAAAWSTNRTR